MSLADAEPGEKPGDDVLIAFGAAPARPRNLTGGRGRTWMAGNVVFRPHGDAEESIWKARVLADREPAHGFRTSRPIPAADGNWVYGGWEAWEWLAGETDESRVVDVIRAGAAFHEAIVHLQRPAFIDHSDDAWSRADRMAWEENPLPRGSFMRRLEREFQPVLSPSQVIHGDLLGNVMFAPDLPPAIIDWAPYWRPAGLGAAIAAVDASCWHGWPAGRLAELGDGIPEWRQLLVRAVAFRIATLHNLDSWGEGMDERHEPVVSAVISIPS
ncbi:hypothetical protein [Paramicrobacterium chengjingii]|uniref:TIGR02569 family protein n=1 Tax=Paramicrobacterium chengjingii TaxID=2769067 RepID=A0ABX6YHZ8_9MICO|nr:hypothetical protein [Microbacterium chengjingii]QPZ37967.1 hypothetical protein HCR76_14325 [Microbacterium chengjingii]